MRPTVVSEGESSHEAASAGVWMKKLALRTAMPAAARGKSPTKRMPASGMAMAAMHTLPTSEASATSCERGDPRKTVP